jgi:glycosyltransferase involved in cell wall biosynthesis
MGWFSYKNNNNVKIVTSILDNDKDDRLPPDIIFLPIISQFNLPYNETTVIKIPSLLKSLAILSKEEPTEIYISTPGPIGLIGLLLARLFSIKAIGVYHTDFAREVESIAEDVAVTELVENYTRWFYSMMDTIKVPSKEYLTLLANRGLDRSKMQILIKGIDTNLFQVKTEKKAHLMYKYQIKDGINLLYAGRISKDKNLDFLIEIHRLLSKKRRDINLLIIGDGPYYNDLLEKASQSERIHFTGKIPREELPELYSSSDVFVFPSTTDTFGMVVLEAQACGLPSVVSDVGGPKEILVDGKTGYVAENNNLNDWIAKVEKLIEMKEKEPVNYAVIKECARLNVLDKFTWEKYFEGILGNGANN